MKSEEELRIEYRTALLSIAQNSKGSKYIPGEIIESDIYRRIKKYISGTNGVSDDHPLLEELEKEMVTRFSTNFTSNLRFLTNVTINKNELNTALLVKCGFTPSEIAKLLNKTISTIGSRRESIGYKIFGEKISVKTIDGIIRLL